MPICSSPHDSGKTICTHVPAGEAPPPLMPARFVDSDLLSSAPSNRSTAAANGHGND
ncbi:MAG: hypothetical protein IT342_13640 [Candidatus Melainabacteria bacterium]|nr:hypothetical protein [Candidatus Melainabacteria bacterium]